MRLFPSLALVPVTFSAARGASSRVLEADVTATARILAWSLVAVLGIPAPAAAGEPVRACGTSDAAMREPLASDALFVLKGAVGVAGTCGPCLCDANGSGSVGATDALLVLRRAVDGETPLHCPACACTALTLLGTGSRPSSVLAVDLDKDGHRDLVTADLKAGEVSIFRGRGRGVFEGRRAIAVGETPQSVTIADLDGDGHLDLVTSDALPNGLSVLPGDEDGGFGANDSAVFVPTGIAPINSVAADLDGDEDLDLVVANSLSGDISVLLGAGDGSFAAEQRHAVGNGPRWVALADMDGDEFLDAVTANRDSDDVSVLRGDGAGNFGDEQRLAVPDAPYHVSLEDLDGDDRTDLVVSCIGAEGIVVILRSDDNGFEDPVFHPTQGSAIATSLARVNDDVATDIVAANYDHDGSPGVAVFLGNGDGTFAPATFADSGAQPRSLVAADVDEDGTTDVVVANADSDELTVLHGAGDGGLHGALESRATAETLDFVVADFDDDGLDDVATADLYNTVTTCIADGSGHFDRTLHPLNGSPFRLGTGDVDGDQNLDVIAVAASRFVDLVGGTTRGVGPQQRAFVLFGDGEGDVEVGLFSTPLNNGEGNWDNIAIGDIDGDHVPDLAVGYGSIALLRGLSDGRYQSFGDVELVSSSFPALALADIDGDDDNDLLELSVADHLLSVHRNDGAGGFQEPQPYPVSATWTVDAHDVTGDGAMDIVTTGANDGSISVLRGNGQGGFAPEVVSSTGLQLSRYTIVDLDGDGAADIATSAEGGVAVLPGDGKGHFGASASARTVVLPTALSLVDVGSGRFEANAPPAVVGVGREEGADNRLVVLSRIGNCMVP